MTVPDWVGPNFYPQGPHIKRLGFSVPLDGELEGEIEKRAFHDVSLRKRDKSELKKNVAHLDYLTPRAVRSLRPYVSSCRIIVGTQRRRRNAAEIELSGFVEFLGSRTSSKAGANGRKK